MRAIILSGDCPHWVLYACSGGGEWIGYNGCREAGLFILASEMIYELFKGFEFGSSH